MGGREERGGGGRDLPAIVDEKGGVLEKREVVCVVVVYGVCVLGGGGETDECKPNNKYNSMCHCCRHAQEPDETKRCSHKFSHRTPLPYTQRSAR